MYTIRVIDLKAFCARAVIDHFIDIGGAEVLAGVSVLFFAAANSQIWIRHFQVTRLML